jgi:hypothetical protein
VPLAALLGVPAGRLTVCLLLQSLLVLLLHRKQPMPQEAP